MTYFGFLLRFVVTPLLILRGLLWWDRKRGQTMPESLSSWDEDRVLLGHVVTAVTYTTPWDNYLVAKGIWSYDEALVTGKTIGWVPIEEYSFFVLQTILTGSWMQFLAHRLPIDNDTPYFNNPIARLAVTGGLGVIWAAAAASLLREESRDNYLGLILAWALPPIMLQTGFGGDILWRHRGLIAASLLPPTAYLGAMDSIAIGHGTWTINPKNTVEREVIPNLPFEELLFFFLTNVLLVFGVTLVQAKESERRLPKSLQDRYYRFKAAWTGRPIEELRQ